MRQQESKRGCAVILTALPEEYKVVRTHLSNMREEIYKGTVCERGRFVVGEEWWEIGMVQVGIGNSQAAIIAERAIEFFHPDIVLLVGVAGGLKDVVLGDVVAATKIYNYASGKAIETSFLPRPDVDRSSYGLEQRARAEERKTDWLQRIRKSYSGSIPRVFVGPIAAGEVVLASTHSAMFTFLKANCGDALAVDMEGSGFLKAIHFNKSVQALVVCGISDMLDNKQQADDAGSQEMAMHHASAFAFEVLAKLERQQPPSMKAKEDDLCLVDVCIDEHDPIPKLDITLRNDGTRNVSPIRLKIDVLEIGKFYRYDQKDTSNTRTYEAVSHTYEPEILPDSKGQHKLVKISHLLRPDEQDRFAVKLDQFTDDPQLVYTWYYLKCTILYNEQNYCLEADPLLLSIPPVDMQVNNVWNLSDETCNIRNIDAIQSMSVLAADRSYSVEYAIQHILNQL